MKVSVDVLHCMVYNIGMINVLTVLMFFESSPLKSVLLKSHLLPI